MSSKGDDVRQREKLGEFSGNFKGRTSSGNDVFQGRSWDVFKGRILPAS
jgi:hypothetical protein